MLQDVLEAAPSLREKSTVRTVFSFEEGVDQVLLLDLVGDRFGSQVCWVLKALWVAAAEARKRIISTLAQSKREKRRGAAGQNHACDAPAAQDHEEGLHCRLAILGRLEDHDRAWRRVHGLHVTS